MDETKILPDRESRPCKPILIKNLEDIVKGILSFIPYWKSLNIADVGGPCWHRYNSWIQYWTCVHDALADLHQDSLLILKHEFCPQICVDVQASEASLLENGEVHGKFDVDDYHVGHASNCPPPFFCIVVDCHEGSMLILHHEDETYTKPVWVVRALSKSNFATSSPHFRQIRVGYYRLMTRNEDMIRHYTCCNTNLKF
jgi:hypothetical protein